MGHGIVAQQASVRDSPGHRTQRNDDIGRTMERPFQMAHHQHKKAVIDAKRGKMFAKLIKNIEVAGLHRWWRPGNPTLCRRHSEQSRSSVPNDNIGNAPANARRR